METMTSPRPSSHSKRRAKSQIESKIVKLSIETKNQLHTASRSEEMNKLQKKERKKERK